MEVRNISIVDNSNEIRGFIKLLKYFKVAMFKGNSGLIKRQFPTLIIDYITADSPSISTPGLICTRRLAMQASDRFLT